VFIDAGLEKSIDHGRRKLREAHPVDAVNHLNASCSRKKNANDASVGILMGAEQRKWIAMRPLGERTRGLVIEPADGCEFRIRHAALQHVD
jgi:hypothetical protein